MEARWAVFMNHLGVPFFYEHEGYNLDGVFYLPDFFLPVQNKFIEVKNPENVSASTDKASKLAMATGKWVYMFQAPPMFPERNFHDLEGAMAFYPDGPPGACDYYYLWCQCQNCGMYDIQFEGRAGRIKCKCQKGSDRLHNADTYRLKSAYDMAKSWRFEPGASNP